MTPEPLEDQSRAVMHWFGAFRFDPGTGELWRGAEPIPLQAQPARVLAILVGRAGQLVRREDLIRAVWADRFVAGDLALNYCVREIRRALADDPVAPTYLETLRGKGYRFRAAALLPPGRRAGPGPTGRVRARALAAVAVAVVGILAGGPVRRPTPRAGPVVLAVAPFSNLTQVGSCRRFAEVARTLLARELELAAGGTDGPGLRADLEPVPSRSSAQFLLTGIVRESGSSRWVTAYLIRAGDGKLIWSGSLETAFLRVADRRVSFLRSLIAAVRGPA